MKFEYIENTFPAQQYLNLNENIVGWIVRTINGKWSYKLTSQCEIDVEIFETKKEAELALLKIFGE